MFIATFPPHLLLSEYVENIHIFHADFTADVHLSNIYNYVPTHTRFLCFYLDDQVKVKKQNGDFETRARSIIIGPQLTPVTLDLGNKHHVIVVGLKPCGMYRLLGIPLKEIVDCDFDASLLLGQEINYLLEKLSEAVENKSKIAIVEEYLLSKLKTLKTAQPFDKAMELQVLSSGNLPVNYIAAQSNLSLRQLERKSLERIGLTPKLYARMVRFTHAYKYKEISPKTTWNEIAYKCGCFDQMHLIRDFKSFAGFTPHLLKEEDIVRSVRFQKLGN